VLGAWEAASRDGQRPRVGRGGALSSWGWGAVGKRGLAFANRTSLNQSQTFILIVWTV
jgi:hypothetical protein